jgi:LmbE family N-acetylglucosaminyl deacetylase
MEEQQNRKKIVLASLAHPDDESFGMGGTLALYAQQGTEVHLVCGTRGEAGDVDPVYMNGFHSVADVRVHELSCAASALGLTSVNYLGYRDSGMPGSPDNRHPHALVAQPVEEVALKIAFQIRKLRPQVVLTFDPIGGYRHPDHIAMHQATVRAFAMASDLQVRVDEALPPFKPQKLLFHVIPRGYLRTAVRLMRLLGQDPSRYGRNKDIDLTALADVNFPVHVAINYKQAARFQENAAACHASQGGLQNRNSLVRILQRMMNSKVDRFMQAFPTPPEGYLAKDLFEGVSFN